MNAKSGNDYLSDRTIRRQAASQAEQLLTDKDFFSTFDYDNNLEDHTVEEVCVSAELYNPVYNTTASELHPTETAYGDDMECCPDPFPEVDCDSASSCSSHSDNLDDLPNSDDEFVHQLREWVLQSNTPLVHVNSLLILLQPFFPSLPKDARTLLNTSSTYNISCIADGKYHHFGIEAGIKNRLSKCETLQQNDEIFLQVNVDGLPLFKSTKDTFWPILGLIRQEKQPQPFVMGLWYGKSKPSNANIYLQCFIDEMQDILAKGLVFDGKPYAVKIENFVCDTPARSFVKLTKGHGGYQGCDFCEQDGVHSDHRMLFPETDAPSRTNLSFDEMSCEEHHRGESNLRHLNIGMVTQFPLDYMHLVCLGVVKKMIKTWLTGSHNVRMGTAAIAKLSNSIKSLGARLPREFARKGRNLGEYDRWKATEFRTFLLYIGPVALLGKVSEQIYRNFMMLSAGVSILCSSNVPPVYIDYAGELLVSFVKNFGKLYGQDMLIYNVHCLIHLAEQTRMYGPLHNFSGFPFENYLHSLKKLVRKPKFPLQQVIRRLNEQMYSRLTKKRSDIFCKKKHNRGPVPHHIPTCIQYEQIHSPNFTFSVNDPDNAVLIAGNTYIIKNVLCHDNFIQCVCQKFCQQKPFFMCPFDSQRINVSVVSSLAERLYIFDFDEISAKVILFPLNGNYVSYPML